MKIINKKAVVALLIAFATSTTFAERLVIKPTQSTANEIVQWEFKTINDGYFFLIGTYSKHKVVIHVNETTHQGLVSDPVTVYCNASKYLVEPGNTLTCYGHVVDTSSMAIEQSNLKNGATGTYEIVPLEQNKLATK